MKSFFKTQLQSKIPGVVLLLSVALFYGCGTGPNSSSANQQGGTDEIVTPKNPDGFDAAIGTVLKTTPTEIDLTVKDETLSIALTDSLRIYATVPGSLDNVKSSSFIGVATKKQADGLDEAFQILIFPEELRGLNEGSFMLGAAPDSDSNAGRMTNGSASRMTNGSASRMSNGSVKKTDGPLLTIHYQGHSRTVNVPPNTPVAEYKVVERKINPGDKVLALTKKNGNGAYQTSKILIL